MKRNILPAVTIAVALVASSSTHAVLAAPIYTFNNFTLSDPSGNTFANGINDSGQVVGYYTSATALPNAFIYNSSSGATTTFNVPSALGPTYANAINNAGEVVGSYAAVPIPSLRVQQAQPFVRYTQGFSRDPSGAITILNVPATNGVEAVGINNAGQIVGNYSNFVGPGGVNGFLLDPLTGVVTTLTIGGGAFPPQDINSLGQIVGYNDIRDPAGNYTRAPDPAGSSVNIVGINDVGQVVGDYYGFGGVSTQGFVLDLATGVLTNVVDPAAIGGTIVTGINDAGQISGWYYAAVSPSSIGSVATGFVATPQAAAVPEPSTVLIIGSGLVALGLIRRRAERS